ncbi:MAG TPA: hypothetical protein VNC41_18440, partial [Acidimicrobiia bacterium]|nr:hypothetical protein [Acidimicrobiia bacterium]
MLLRRRTARLLTVAAGATLTLGLMAGTGAGTAQAFDTPDLPETGFPQVTFDPCLIVPAQCDPGPTVPDGPGPRSGHEAEGEGGAGGDGEQAGSAT